MHRRRRFFRPLSDLGSPSSQGGGSGLNGVPCQIHLLAIVVLQEAQAQSQRIDSTINHILEKQNVARAFGHLATVKEQVLGVNPMSYDFFTDGRIRLCLLVFVVRESKINATGVYVDGVAQVVDAHRRTLHVPTGESHTPRRIPHQLGTGVAGDFPQSPVRVKTLAPISFRVFFDGKTCTGAQGVELVAADRPVVVDGAGIEVHRPIATDISVLVVNEFLDQLNHQVNGFGCSRGGICRRDVEARQVREVSVFVETCHIKCTSIFLLCLTQDLVFARFVQPTVISHVSHVGDVLHDGDVKSLQRCHATDQIREQKCTKVAHVREAIHRGSAGIDRQTPRCRWLNFFHATSASIG